MNEIKRSELIASFIDAKSLLINNGWCKMLMHDEGKSCLIGALRLTAGIDNYKNCLYVIRQTRVIPYEQDIEDWNDDPLRTIDDIINLLDICIDRIKKEER